MYILIGLLISLNILLILSIVFISMKLKGIAIVKTNAAQKKLFEYKRRQFEEFYAPIQILLCINKTLFEKSFGTDIWDTVRTDILIPNNEKILDLLLHKAYLINEQEIPESFVNFVIHTYVWKLYAVEREGSPFGYFQKNVTFSQEFQHDTSRAYTKVKQEYVAMINSESN